MSSNVDRVRQVNEGYVEPTQVNRVTTVRSVLFEAVGSTATALRAIKICRSAVAAMFGHPTIQYTIELRVMVNTNTIPIIMNRASASVGGLGSSAMSVHRSWVIVIIIGYES